MLLLLKKFTVVHNGVTYSSGSVMNLSEADAEILLAEGVAVKVEQDESVAQAPVETKVDFDAMTLAELKQYCKDNGIDTGKARRKNDILDLLGGGESLPMVNFQAVIK